ncbi:hypothetical protein KSF78_0007081 [Schistosoma japonicum]|nr:hypothetical protein KSF78_0007081 [Schistosoma japonicum]
MRVKQTSSHTLTEAVGVVEREVQVTQTERPVVTSLEQKVFKTVKPDHMISMSASYAESPVKQPPPRQLTETATQATAITAHVTESSQHEIIQTPIVHVKAPLVTEIVSLELPTPEPVRKTPLVEATQFVKRSTVDQQIDTVPVSSSDIGAQTDTHKALLDGAAHLSLKRADATLQAKPVQLCMVDSWSEMHAPVVPVHEPPKPVKTLEACVQTTKESVCVVDSATDVQMKSPESVLDSAAAFVKRASVNAEVQVDRVSTPVVSLTTHKLESKPVETSLCTSCGHRYVKTEQTACQTVQPQIEPVPIAVKTSNVAMQTSKFSTLCQTTSELVTRVTPTPYVESSLSMSTKIEKPVTRDVGMQFGMRVATRVMSSSYQVKQTSSHTLTEAVGVVEREVQVTQTERPVVTSLEQKVFKTVKPDHMISMSASYAESPVKQPPPRQLTETATQATAITAHVTESSQHEIIQTPIVHVKAPLVTEIVSLELPTPEPVRKTPLVEATQFVKRSTVDQQIDTVPVSSSDIGAQTDTHKALLDGAAHLSLKRADATLQAKPVQLCMVDSWSEMHAPVVPVHEPPKPVKTLEACVQTTKESVCVVDSATDVQMKSPESVLDSAAAFVKRASVNAEVQVDRVSTPVVSLTTHKLESKPVETSLCTSCGHRYVKTEQTACQTVQPQIEPVPIAVKTSNVAMQTSKFSTLCQTTSELVTRVTPTPYVESSLSMSTKIEKPVTRDVGMQFGMRVATRVMSSSYQVKQTSSHTLTEAVGVVEREVQVTQTERPVVTSLEQKVFKTVKQTSSHTLTEAVGVVEREVQVTQTERPVVTSLEQKVFKTVKPDHMISMSASYAESPVKQPPPRQLTETATQATAITAHVTESSQHEIIQTPIVHVKAPLVTEIVSLELPTPEPVRKTPLVEATQFVKRSTVDQQIDTVPVSSSDIGAQTDTHKALLDGAAHLSLKRADATLQAKPVQLCMVDSWSEMHAPVVPVHEPPKPVKTLEACVQTTKESVCVVDSATDVQMKSPESVLDSAAAFVKRASVNAEVQVDRVSTPVVSLTTHKLESKPVETSLCTSCGHRYVKTEQTACQTVQPQIEPVPIAVKTSNVAMQTSKFSTLCQTTSELVTRVTPTPYVESSLSMSTKIEKPVTRDVGMQFGMRVATRVMSSSYQVKQTSSHTLTEAVGVVEREVQVTQTERPVVTSLEQKVFKTVKPDHMISMSASYAESPVKQPPPRQLTETATQATAITAHVTESSQHEIIQTPIVHVKAPLVTEIVSLELPTPEPVRKTPLVEATQFVKRSTVDQQIDTVPVSSSDIGAQTDTHKALLDGAAHLSLKRADATLQAKPVQLCMVDSWSEMHAPVVPVHEPPKPVKTLEACVQTTKESVCVVDSATDVQMKSPESVLDSAAAFVKRASVNAEVQVDRVSTPVVSLTTHKLESKPVETSLCTSCGHRYVKTEQTACQTVQPQIEPVPIAVKTSNVAMQTSKFSTLCQTTSELVTRVTPTPYVESSLSMSTKIEKPVTRDVGMQFGMRVATRVMSSSYQVKQTSSHTLTEAVGVVEREVQVTQTERPVVTSLEQKVFKTVKPDHMISMSASYAESPVKQPPPRQLTETATQATAITAHVTESSQHEIIQTPIVHVKAPLVTEIVSLELPTPEPVRKTPLVEATQFVKRSTVDQQIDTVPVSSSDIGAQTDTHKALLDGAAHLSLKRADATLQAKPVQLCMVDSWSEMHAPVVPVHEPPKPVKTLEACVQTTKESVCVVDSATDVQMKSPESVLDSAAAFVKRASVNAEVQVDRVSTPVVSLTTHKLESKPVETSLCTSCGHRYVKTEQTACQTVQPQIEPVPIAVKTSNVAMQTSKFSTLCQTTSELVTRVTPTPYVESSLSMSTKIEKPVTRDVGMQFGMRVATRVMSSSYQVKQTSSHTLTEAVGVVEREVQVTQTERPVVTSLEQKVFKTVKPDHMISMSASYAESPVKQPPPRQLTETATQATAITAHVTESSQHEIIQTPIVHVKAPLVTEIVSLELPTPEPVRKTPLVEATQFVKRSTVDQQIDTVPVSSSDIGAQTDTHKALLDGAAHLSLKRADATLQAKPVQLCMVDSWSEMHAPVVPVHEPPKPVKTLEACVQTTKESVCVVDSATDVQMKSPESVLDSAAAFVKRASVNAEVQVDRVSTPVVSLTTHKLESKPVETSLCTSCGHRYVKTEQTACQTVQPQIEPVPIAVKTSNVAMQTSKFSTLCQTTSELVTRVTPTPYVESSLSMSTKIEKPVTRDVGMQFGMRVATRVMSSSYQVKQTSSHTLTEAVGVVEREVQVTQTERPVVTSLEQKVFKTTTKESVCVVDSATDVQMKSPESVLDSAAAFVKRASVNAEVQVDRVSTPVVSLTTHKLESKPVETSLCTSCGHRYVKTEQTACQTVQPQIEPVPIAVKTSNVAMQTSKFSTLCQTTSELVTRVTPTPYVESSLSMSTKIEKPVTRDVGMQFGMRVATRVMSSSYQVKQTSSHTLTEAVGVVEREVQVTQTERPVVTSLEQKVFKTVKPDHMISMSASYAESPVKQPPPRQLTETATQATAITAHVTESSQHEIIQTPIVHVKAPLVTEIVSLELPTPEPVRKTPLVEATQFVKRSTVDQQIDTVPVSSSDIGAQTDTHKALLDGAAHLSLKRADATLQAKPVQLCMVDSWSEMHAPVVPVHEPPKPVKTLEACVQTTKESVCVVDSATDVQMKSPESVLDSAAAFVKRASVNAEVQVDRVSTPVVSLTTHKLESKPVETSLCTSCGHRYVKTEQTACQTVQPQIEPVPIAVKTSNVAMQTSKFSTLCQTTSELVTRVTPTPYVESSLSMSTKIEKPVTRDVGMQFGMRVATRVMSSSYQVKQTSSHTLTEAVGVVEREVQVTQTERPVVTSLEQKVFKTVKPDHMISMSASYAESPVKQPPPRQLTETATQATAITAHVTESSQHEIIQTPIVHVKAPLVTEIVSLELPTPEPVRKTPLVEATQFVKRSTVDQQIDTVPVSSSDIGAQTDTHKALLDGAAHLSLKRADATLQAKPVQLCMVDSWSEMHAPVVPVHEPPKPVKTLEACVQTTKESVCVVDSATDVQMKSPESVLDSAAAFVKRASVNAEVQVDRVSTPVVSLTTHKLESKPVETSLCTSCGHRYVKTEQTACQTVQPQIEPVPIAVKTSNVAMQTSKFSTLCQTTSELVTRVTPTPYVESSLSMSTKIEKPVTRDVGMQFGMRVATRVMSSSYQVKQTSSHTLTEAVGVVEREVQVTQTERPVVTSLEQKVFKTVKPDHMISMSASYAESPVKQPPPRQLTETATQATAITAHVTESSQHEIIQTPIVHVKAPLVTEIVSLELPTPEPVRKTPLVEATQFVKRSTVDQQIDTVPVSSSDIGAQTDTHKALLDGAAHLSLKRADATLQAKPVQLCMVDSWSEMHAPVVPVHEPPKPVKTLEACVQTTKESVCVVDSATDVQMKSPESVLDSAAAFVKRASVNAEVQVDRVSTPVVSLTTHKLESKPVETSLCTSCGHRYVKTEQTACQTVQPQIEPVPIAVKTSNVAMQTSKFSTLCQTTSELVTRVTPTPYVESSLSMSTKIEKPVTRDVGMQFGMRVATRVMSSSYQVKQTSSHTLTEAVGVVEREVQVTQTERPVVTSLEQKVFKTVKPDHMISMSASYAESPVKQPPPRQLTETATQATAITAHVTESSQHEIIQTPIVHVKAPLVTEIVSLELPTPEPVRKTPLVEATQFVKRSTVDQQIDTVPVSSSDIGAQTDTHKALLDGAAHLSLKRADATLQAKPVQLCMVDSWSEMHAPVVPVHEPPKPVKTLEACVQTTKESVCVVDSATDVQMKSPESVLDSAAAFVKRASVNAEVQVDRVSTPVVSLTTHKLESKPVETSLCTSCGHRYVKTEQTACQTVQPQIEPVPIAVKTSNVAMQTSKFSTLCQTTSELVTRVTPTPYVESSLSMSTKIEKPVTRDVGMQFGMRVATRVMSSSYQVKQTSSHTLTEAVGVVEREVQVTQTERPVVTSLEQKVFKTVKPDHMISMSASYAESPVKQPPPRQLTETATQATAITAHVTESSQHEIIQTPIVHVKAPLVTEIVSLELPTPEPVRKTPLVEATQFVKRSTVDQQIDTVPVSSSDIGAQTDTHKALLDGAAHLSLKRADATLQAKPVQLCMVDSWSEMHAPVVPVHEPPKPVKTLEACVQTTKESVCVVDSATDVQMKSPESVLDSAAAFVKRASVNAEVQVDRVSTPVVSLTTHKLESKPVETSLCTSCGHRYVKTEQTACQTVQPQIEPVPIAVKTSNVAMQTSKFSTLCQTTSELVTRVTPTPYVESSLSMSTKIEKPVTRDVGMQFGMRVATRVMSSSYQVKQTSSHTLTEAVGVVEREVQVTQTERPVVTSLEQKVFKTVKPDHMISMSASYAESPVKQPPPRQLTETATQATAITAHVTESSQHEIIQTPIVHVKAPLVTEIVSLELPTPEPVRKTPLVEATQFVKRSTVDQQIDTVPVSSSDIGAQTDTHKALLDGAAHLSLKRADATLQAKPVQLCMVDSWSEMHAPVVPVHEPPKPVKTFEFCVQAVTETVASQPKISHLITSSGFFFADNEPVVLPSHDEDIPLDSGDLEWELVDDNLKDINRCLLNSSVQTDELFIRKSEFQKEPYRPVYISQSAIHTSVNRKNFAVQYIYEPLQEDAGCQTTDKLQKQIKIYNQDAATMTDDTEPKVAVLLQNISSTDIRERLIERYYYSAQSSCTLVTDAEVQVNLTSSVYRGQSRELYMKETSTDYIEHHKRNENLTLEESSGHDYDEQSLIDTSYSQYIKRLLHEGSVTEVWEKCPPTHSIYEHYQSRREYGSVREQASMAMEEPVTAADVGIQIVFDSPSHDSPSESEMSRSESPLSGSSYTYEEYLIRSRLGQVCEVQCQFCPTHIPTASQTEHYGISLKTERHEKLKEDIFESYQRRLIKDQIAEAWTQVERDSYMDSRMEQVSEPIDIIEERFLEITEKKSKKVYSQVKITEEFAEEEDLIVCELGVQTDDQQYFIKPKDGHASFDVDEESHKRLTTSGIQTSVIRLASIIHSGDLEWADKDLCEVIKAGIRFLGSDEHKIEDISVSKYKSHQVDTYSRLSTDSTEKVLISSGTQVIPMELNLERKFQKEWQSETISFHESEEPFQSDVVDKVGMLTDETHHMSKILVQLRQRTLQYELFESQQSTSCIHWNNIREVASPRTGLFAPVAMAIRRGWIRLGEVNEYVDPMTGVAIPLETAYQQGRIRLTSSSSHYDRNIITNTPVLLLIERVYFSWCKAYLTSVIDTATGEVLSPNSAIENGILETTEDEIRLLDSLTNSWITIEEGAGRQIIQLEPSTPTTESMEDELDEPVSCKVYQLTHVCPGGEPSPWLGPIEAVRLGLLNWETGEVAADWPARPMLLSMSSAGQLSPEDFIPTKWCTFLTARQAGWLRFTEESEPQRYITTSGTPNKEPGSLLLSTQVNLLAPSQVSLNYEQDDIEDFHHRHNRLHHEFNIPRTRSEDIYTTREMSSSNLYRPINIIAGNRSASCTRVDTRQQSYNDYKLIPSNIQIRHESDEHSWTSETQIWEEYQETSSRTVSPDYTRETNIFTKQWNKISHKYKLFTLYIENLTSLTTTTNANTT